MKQKVLFAVLFLSLILLSILAAAAANLIKDGGKDLPRYHTMSELCCCKHTGWANISLLFVCLFFF